MKILNKHFHSERETAKLREDYAVFRLLTARVSREFEDLRERLKRLECLYYVFDFPVNLSGVN